MLTEKKIREWRDEATENIERIDSARGLTPAQQHINALLRPREARIQTLCEELLDYQNGIAQHQHTGPGSFYMIDELDELDTYPIPHHNPECEEEPNR